LRIKLKSFSGIAVSVSAAVVLSLVLHDDADIRLVAPLVYLFVVIATSFFWGRAAAIVGSAAGSLTFCILLFPPLGSIRISDPHERTILFLFQVSAIGLAFLAPPSLEHQSCPLRTRRGSPEERNSHQWMARQIDRGKELFRSRAPLSDEDRDS